MGQFSMEISCATGSVLSGNQHTVTFQSAGAIAEAVGAGDRFGSHIGRPIRIAAIVGNTATLAFPWPGPTQTAAPYEIQYTPYAAQLREDVNKVMKLFGEGTLPALGGLNGTGGNKLPRLTGAGTADTVALSEFMANVLGAANGGAAQEALGGGAIGRELFSSENPVPARRLLLSESWADSSTTPPGNDLNNIVNAGHYATTGATANLPPEIIASGSVVIALPYNASTQTQLVIRVTSANRAAFMRQKISSVWSEWVPLHGQFGSTDDGYWIRLTDGTQLCSNWIVGPAMPAGTGAEIAWTYPVRFLSATNVNIVGMAGLSTSSTAGIAARISLGVPANNQPVTSRIHIFNDSPSNAGSSIIRLFAFGRWF